MSNGRRFYGKYRGTVVQNVDPEQRGRIQVMVPDVSGLIPSTWAMPCVPIAGKQSGSWFVPQIGAGVWIEFEQGDPDYPIWTGCFWGIAAEVPALALAGNPASPSIVLQSGLQNVVTISDLPGPAGGIMLKSTTGAMILVNDVGITISNGKGATIVLAGPTVTINNGALVVT
ncbi:MAG TPA: phage baseplate assembly protein V [Mizugakiibacter sp.]|uniref:Baseplate assembly protein n=1 Tax=Mizugakiibacter sediminis TaxID=1475481 RepID=A0A0K8QN92_9GAMM|nr:phage baseplate assembly protein V [Mizugakiibacter sediminis]GAP66338.1 phage-related baseplate assembly protein [Mizugakiibacter sediminis]